VLLLVGLGCANCAPELTSEEVQAQEIWHRHEGVLAQGLEGRRNSDEFAAAVAFFREVSGIEVRVHFHPVMRPKPEAPEDLERIREWYSKNKERLYFDEETNRVQVNSRPGASMPSTEPLHDARAQEIWTQHETAVAKALDGPWTQPAFLEAYDFFVRVTGVEIDREIFEQDKGPFPNAQQDLGRIREWYSRNKDRLYFDEEAERVNVNSR